jgi:hypothetical protein
MVALGALRFAGHHLSHAEDAVQRGPDFVAHVGEEFAFRLARRFGLLPGVFEGVLPFADALGHDVERPGEGGDFVGAVDRHLGVLAALHTLRGVAQRQQRTGHAPR